MNLAVEFGGPEQLRGIGRLSLISLGAASRHVSQPCQLPFIPRALDDVIYFPSPTYHTVVLVAARSSANMVTSSRPRPSEQASRQSRAQARLPTYQPPAHPLNEAAQRALYNLPSAHKLDKLKRHLEKSVKALTDNAGHINDCYQAKAERQQKRRARRAQQGIEDEDEDGTVDEMKAQVEEMTERMEASVRNIIDNQATVEGTEKALKEVGQNVAAGGGAVAPTQSTLGASQFRQRRRRRGAGVDEDDSDFDDATSQGEDQENAGLSGLLSRKIAEQKSRYENLSMRDR